MGEKFDLGAYLKQAVPDSGTMPRQIETIDIGLIDSDERNFYKLDGIEELAGNIELFGLQQPIVVRPSDADSARVVIVSGHRRTAALRLLVEEGKEQFRQVPVIRENESRSPALQELALIFANNDTRKMTSFETAKQAERVQALLYQLQEEGVPFPGRMRDHVAEACKVTKTRLSNLKVIREHLIPEGMTAWEAGDLAEDAALKLARLPEEYQQRILAANKKRNNGRVRWLYSGTVEVQAKLYASVDELQCQLYGCECTNRDNKKAYLESQGDNYYGNCHKQCCSKCDKLVSCKYACPKLAEQIKRLKADRKAEQAREKALKEEKERTDRELQDLLWSRFAQARKDAGVSLEKLFEKWGVKYPSSCIREFEQHERGEGLRLDNSSATPLGPYSGYLSHAQYLIMLADTLDVSLDYLLGRTPCPNPEQVVFGVDLAESKPQWRTDDPPEGTEVFAKFELPGTDKRLIRTAYYSGGKYYFSRVNRAPIDTDCLGWTPIPED